MRTLFWVVLSISVALWLGVLLHQDGSTLTIVWREQPLVNMTLLKASIFGLVGFVLLYIVFRLFGWIGRIPKHLRERGNRKAWVKGAKGLKGALIQLIEGNYAKAEKLTSAEFPDEESLVHHWLGAQAAHKLGRSALRDSHIEAAITANPDADRAMRIVQTEMMLESGEFVQALTNCEKPALQGATQYADLRYRAAAGAGDHRTALSALKQRFERKAISSESLVELASAHMELALDHCENAADLESYIGFMPRALKNSDLTMWFKAKRLLALSDETAGLKIMAKLMHAGMPDKVFEDAVSLGQTNSQVQALLEDAAKRFGSDPRFQSLAASEPPKALAAE
ncbi:MAG: hypothetical protein HWE20_01400 [Gammaproteobacteria bacterium]|nr:hypothetical protein [Gammaproteobacteria bacterium]